MTALRARPVRREHRSSYLRSSRFDAPLLVSDLPAEVPFAFVGRCLPTTSPAELRLQIHRVPTPAALDLLHRAHLTGEAELADGRASRRPFEVEAERDGALELGRRIAAREEELWRVGVSVHALGTTRPRAERVRSEIADRFSALGFRVRPPVYEVHGVVRAPDLTATEPRPPGYWHTLPTDGVAAFFPFVDESVAEPGGVLVGLHLEDASPVFLERWSHSSHSWGVFGVTGSGKSFASALWSMRSRWVAPELTLVFLDPLGEFSELVRRLGGEVVVLGAKSSVRINPLDPGSTGEDRTERAARVAAWLRALFPSLTDDERARLDSSLVRLYDRPSVAPTFSDLLERIDSPGTEGDRLATLLEVFRSGSLSYLNGPTTADLSRTPLAVNVEGVPDDQLAFHLAYLLDAVVAQMRRRPGPKLLVVDEAHRLAAEPAIAAWLDRLVRSARHFDAGLLLLSQNPDDFLQHESGRSILRNLAATTLLHLNEVSRAAREFWGLTEAEAEWLPRARLPGEAGYSEGLLRLGPAHLPIAVVASTPEFEFLGPAMRGPRGPPGPVRTAGALPVERDV